MKLVRLLLAAPILFVACGGAPEGARSPSREQDGVPDRAPTSIEEAQDQIAEAQRRLSGGNTEESGEDAKASQSNAPPPPPPPPPSDNVSPSADAPAKTKTEAPVDACVSPCRAFASMRRAVEALCRMTGETDDRCVKARRTLETTNGRVATCRCSR